MKKLTLIASAAMAAQLATAASITYNGSFEQVGTADLTALGNVDWAYWNTADNPAAAAATNDMDGGAGIGVISASGGSGIRGAGSTTTGDFSFTNGSVVASGDADNVTGLLNTTLAAVNTGVQLDFTLATAGQAYTINVWTAGYSTEFATIAGTLTGATTYNSGNLSNPNGEDIYGAALGVKYSYLNTFTVVADSDNDVFNFNIETAGTQYTSSHVIISAATISAVPEPSAYALLAGSLALGAVMIRRRRS
jgi:hypothetical protein